MRATERFGELPEPILQHILSFLLFKDAARMSRISKIWNNAFNSLPCLNFGDQFFAVLPRQFPKRLDVMHQTLANRQKHNISVQKFSLGTSVSEWLHNWVDALVVCNIKVLNLKLHRPDCGRGYNKLPDSLFNAKSLTVLKLEGFIIQLPCNGIIKFSSLREFHLHFSFLNEEFVRALCTTCRNLEVLYLWSIDGLSCIQVGQTLSKLKKVSFLNSCDVQLVDIRATTNIEDLWIHPSHYDAADIKVVNITACKALKCLDLKAVVMTEKQLEEMFSCLQNLEKFVLSYCEMLKTLKISSVHLKQLHVIYCPNMVAVELDTPNLIRFSYNCYSLPALKLKASGLLEANISFDESGLTPDGDWYSKIMKFLDNFNHSMSIKLTCKNDKALVIPKDMRENLLPPLYGTNFMQVNLVCRLINYSVVDLLDSMFWFSPQLDTLSYFDPDLKTLKFIYEDGLHEVEKKRCCTSQPWECWRHKLKQVEIHNFGCMEKKGELRKYFSTSSDISEIIEVPPVEFKHPYK